MHRLPCSKTRARKLGETLAAGRPLTPEDEALLDEIEGVYLLAQVEVSDRLADLGIEAPGRVKAPKSLGEKVARDRIALGRVQDIAGVRHVLQDGVGLAGQTAVAELVMNAFAEGANPPRLRDRRGSDHSHGYRAVHVIVWCDELPVEVQIRTPLQQKWAEANELFAEVCGRQVRYGQPPWDLPRHPGVTAQIAELMAGLSEVIESNENLGERVRSLNERLAPGGILGMLMFLRSPLRRVSLARVGRYQKAAGLRLMALMDSLTWELVALKEVAK